MRERIEAAFETFSRAVVRRRWLSIAICLAIAAIFFHSTSFQWTSATVPGYVQQLGGDPAQIGLAFGLFTRVPAPTNKGLPIESGDLWHPEKSEAA